VVDSESATAVALSQLAEFPFIDSPPGFGNRMMVDQDFAASGVEREVTLEMADIGQAAGFIRAGLGIGFLSHFLVDDQTGLDTLQIADHELALGTAHRDPGEPAASAATEAFLNLLSARHPSPQTSSQLSSRTVLSRRRQG
jgi:DNA-binding transcriptional LysR family regulator